MNVLCLRIELHDVRTESDKKEIGLFSVKNEINIDYNRKALPANRVKFNPTEEKCY